MFPKESEMFERWLLLGFHILHQINKQNQQQQGINVWLSDSNKPSIVSNVSRRGSCDSFSIPMPDDPRLTPQISVTSPAGRTTHLEIP